MFIELLDGLRCVSEHPQIPLVAAIMQRDDRFVVGGTLGCPTCRREYPIIGGVAYFADEHASAPLDPVSGDDDGAMRIGAFLAASDGVTVALVGEWARYAVELSELVGLRAYAINPRAPVGESERVGSLVSDNRLPFTNGSLRGVAIDESGWSDDELRLAAQALSPTGRIVAPAAAAVPADVQEIARDDRWWIGEKRGPLVALHRR